jgi:ATPase family protein associated with various cellular activities (AAA)
MFSTRIEESSECDASLKTIHMKSRGLTLAKLRPFCLRPLIDNIRSMSSQVPLLICGGYGVGKTTLLNEIREELDATAKDNLLVLRGKNPEKVRRQLREVSLRAEFPKIVLIDDLDAILTGQSGTTSLRSVQEALLLILPEVGQIQDGYRFIATSTPHWLWQPNTMQSSLVSQLHRIDLDPWSYGWEIAWQRDFEGFFRNRLTAARLRLWMEEIIALTGGHPALYGPAVARLNELCEHVASLETEEGTARDRCVGPTSSVGGLKHLIRPSGADVESEHHALRTQIRQYLEDYLVRDSIVRIGSAIKELENSDNALYQEASRWLVNFARQGASEADPPDNTNIRIILEDFAVVYRRQDTGRYVIPGLIMRSLIRRVATEQSEIAIIANLLDPDSRGEVRFGALPAISMTGSQWRLFRALYDNLGEIVSTDQLVKSAGLKGKRPLPYAVQRLQTVLNKHGFRGVLLNEYGQGYRLLARRPMTFSGDAYVGRGRSPGVLVEEMNSGPSPAHFHTTDT